MQPKKALEQRPMKVASLSAENLSARRRFRDKGPDDEGFPLGPRLIPSRLRSEILAFYRFARMAGDIADDPALSAEQKAAWLEALDAVLDGRTVSRTPADVPAGALVNAPSELLAPAHTLRVVLVASGITTQHARHMLQAFGQDAVKRRYRDWSELLAYCRFSAAPVGRFVLDLYGEERAAWPAAEALCAALKILSQIRDCKQDYLWRGRVFLPVDWLEAAGATPDSLDHPAASPELRSVFDRTLEGVLRLTRAARPLPRQVRNRGLRLKAAVILVMAEMLAAKLGKQDPLAGRVGLSKLERLWAGLRGVARALTQRW